jgi:DNA-binding XRE family transcriptional regulator
MAGNQPKLHADDYLFAHSVKSRREAAGLSQDQLGALVGLSGQTIHLIEKGRRGVSRGEALSLARTFETTVEQMTETVAMSAVRLHHLVGDVVRQLEADLSRSIEDARSHLGEVRRVTQLAVAEIDPSDERSEAMSRYLAESINDAVYLLQELPAFLDAHELTWDGLIDGSEPANPKSWAAELTRALTRARAL